MKLDALFITSKCPNVGGSKLPAYSPIFIYLFT